MKLIKATNYPLQWENKIEEWMNKNGLYQLGKLNQNVMHDLNLFLSILKYPFSPHLGPQLFLIFQNGFPSTPYPVINTA